ncbi:MAG: cytidine deaminase [Negativicutes bacterium]|nr:cytidine deaminase [Negativicutes bacterium]
MTDQQLYQISVAQQHFAYAPYSHFRVGAALLCKSGTIYGGCNIESAAYSATLCAERTALAKAVSAGEQDFTAIAISASSGEFTFPCGVCRQLLAEFNPDLQVIVGNERGEFKRYSLRELLPEAFTGKNL